MRTYLPPAPFGRRLLLRTVVLWTFLRVAAVLGGAQVLALLTDLEGTARPDGLPLGGLGLGLTLALLVGVLVLGETARRSELLFLGNLGWSKSRMVATSLLICLGLEVGVQLILAR